jgi:cytochrome P450
MLCGAHTFEDQTSYFDIAPTCCTHLFGVTSYFTTDPENIHAILSTNFEDYGLGSRRQAMKPLLGVGIFVQDGKNWNRSREVMKRQFVRVHRETPGAFKPHVESLIEGIAAAATTNGSIDLKPLMFANTLDTTTSLLFGEPHSSMPKAQRDAISDNLDLATLGCGIRLRLADGAFLYNPAKFKNACKAVRGWAMFFADKAMRYMDEHGEDEVAEKYPFIIDLWRETRDVELVRDMLLHVLVAGRDSMVSLLCWTL